MEIWEFLFTLWAVRGSTTRALVLGLELGFSAGKRSRSLICRCGAEFKPFSQSDLPGKPTGCWLQRHYQVPSPRWPRRQMRPRLVRCIFET